MRSGGAERDMMGEIGAGAATYGTIDGGKRPLRMSRRRLPLARSSDTNAMRDRALKRTALNNAMRLRLHRGSDRKPTI